MKWTQKQYSLLTHNPRPEISPLSIPETKAVAANVPMKKISELFSDEEKEQLRGIVDAGIKGKGEGPAQQEKGIEDEESES